MSCSRCRYAARPRKDLGTGLERVLRSILEPDRGIHQKAAEKNRFRGTEAADPRPARSGLHSHRKRIRMNAVRGRLSFEDGNRNFESCLPWARFNQRERAAMAFHDRFRNRQPQTCPCFVAGPDFSKEAFENPSLRGFRNTRAAIGY